MQTFLPYPNFNDSARVLDDKRLGNQCYRECKIIVTGGWKHHPVSKMWKGHEYNLCNYAISLAIELFLRNREVVGARWYNWFLNKRNEFKKTPDPYWLGSEKLHASHRSNLLRKDQEWYGKFGWVEPNDLEYFWPEQSNKH